MADEPKKTRKRAVKKSAEVAEKSVDKKSEKKSKAAIPTPIFQAAPVAPRGERKKSDSDTQENENRRRRRRRGGKDRRRSDREEKLDSEKETPKKNSYSKNEIQPAGEPVFKKRRRRRRSGAEDVTPGESVEDGVVTVVKVRDARPAQEKSNDRGRDRKNFDRRDRRDRFRDRGRDRSRFNEHREFNRDYKENRRRGTILTDAEFLARRESVDREMLVRQQGDRTQIAILEDKLSRARILDKDLPKDEVLIGATVKLKDLNSDEELEYTLVSEEEADYNQNKISVGSPVGQGLIGHKENEILEIKVPAGILRYKVIKISRQ